MDEQKPSLTDGALTTRDLQSLHSGFLDSSPTRGFQDFLVVLPDEPNFPFEIEHNLSAELPTGVRFEVMQSTQPVLLYHDPQDAWGVGFVTLRATCGAGLSIRVRLTVDDGDADALPEATDLLSQSFSAPAAVEARAQAASAFNYRARLEATGAGSDRNGVSLVTGSGPALILDPGGSDNSWAIMADVTEGSANPRLLFGAGARDSVAYAMALHPDASNTADKWWLVPAVSGELNLGAVTGDGFGNNLPINRIRSNYLHVANGLFEFARTAAMGEFTSFTPTLTAATGTWTVGGGSLNCGYTRLGKRLIAVRINVENTSLSATPNQLDLTLPFTLGNPSSVTVAVFHGGGWDNTCAIQGQSGNASLSVLRNGSANFTTGAGLYIRAIILVEANAD